MVRPLKENKWENVASKGKNTFASQILLMWAREQRTPLPALETIMFFQEGCRVKSRIATLGFRRANFGI